MEPKPFLKIFSNGKYGKECRWGAYLIDTEITPLYYADTFADLIQVIYEDDYDGEIFFGRFYTVKEALELR